MRIDAESVTRLANAIEEIQSAVSNNDLTNAERVAVLELVKAQIIDLFISEGDEYGDST